MTLPPSPPPVEILKVAHHGSADDGLPRCSLSLTGSRGDLPAEQRLRAPDASTLAALDAAPGLDVFRTDRQGSIVIESDGRRITTQQARDYAC